ncbi:GtrA family protein [Streptomyces celluloflavus]|uniref:GtrA family protein n=1 Tax=Streptomyces celluloflavus TaxID=58344 RepID=A0ABW7RN41_9ACTN|nr:GtrA family protein [Streptomyces celluloflavus]
MGRPIRRLPTAGQWGRLARFAAVGGVNTVTFYLCYLPLHRVLPYFAAYTAGFLVSLTGSFFLNTYFTYRTRPSWRKFLLFPLTQVTNYAVQSAGLVALVSWCGLNSTVAPLLAALLAIPFTYLVSRRILLPGHRTAAADAPGPGGSPDQTAPSPPVRSNEPA